MVPVSSSKLKLLDAHSLEIPGEAAGSGLGHCHVVEGADGSAALRGFFW